MNNFEISNKSCFLCRNQAVCKYKEAIFKDFGSFSWLNKESNVIKAISKTIGYNCKYYNEYTEEEKQDRGITE